MAQRGLAELSTDYEETTMPTDMTEKAREFMNKRGIHHSINVLPRDVADFAESQLSDLRTTLEGIRPLVESLVQTEAHDTAMQILDLLYPAIDQALGGKHG